MKKQFVYFYFMKNAPDKIQKVVPDHIEYWQKRDLDKYRGGPFADRTGGLISFAAENLEEATKIINNDPFALESILEKKWIKEWIVE